MFRESDASIIIPEDRPAALVDNPLFGDNAVYFGKARKTHMACQSRGQTELIVSLANLGISGEVKMPADLAACMNLLDRINVSMEKATVRFKELAESRTGDERVRQQLMEVLERWFVLGREGAKSDLAKAQPAAEEAEEAEA